ncbi:flagellar assembly peptidoglycan hydrolase FlgJ [Massilia sp. CF038]|uniref:flagellar assembly peptidoglycan hydrolase FlgJ n=1 Tax=Massilia sp. CF038 TaxID=1881045 RepID=UPI00091416B8|nr:flagellar assembly peptidoglycan hydrolase FlgJ [Massilia sp. CF038]SHG44402.1 flagellar protein FlgJ [Massilia sp. CF038]
MIGQTNDISGKFALDTKGMSELKQSAKAGSPDALKGAATQFEAMFINMMMKSMRDATPQDGMLDNQQTKMFTGMLDQQMSQKMATRGVGLADMLIRQLSAQAQSQAIGAQAGTDGAARATAEAAALIGPSGLQAAPPETGRAASGRIQAPHVKEFQDKLASHAAEAESATGIPAKFMLGQAALETGWGKRQIRNADGSNSHNLFGIKAGPGWTGKVATAVTTEYVNGVPRTKVEKFRAYDTPADSFKDYAKLITNNPRYEKVLAHAGDASKFAHGLQRAGYATDPLYAAKLSRIIHNNLA